MAVGQDTREKGQSRFLRHETRSDKDICDSYRAGKLASAHRVNFAPVRFCAGTIGIIFMPQFAATIKHI